MLLLGDVTGQPSAGGRLELPVALGGVQVNHLEGDVERHRLELSEREFGQEHVLRVQRSPEARQR
jgi:hypothetical protein